MIYYFSGTGNSLCVARELARQTGDTCCPITHPLPCVGDVVGVVFPVYAWGVPPIVSRFIMDQLGGLLSMVPRYVYGVMTCGTDCGFTDRLLRQAFEAGGMRMDAAFSIIMPNTYVSLPLFDVDSREEAERRMRLMPERVGEIAEKIRARQQCVKVKRGPIPHIYTYVIRPFFYRFLMDDKELFVEDKKCVGCGKCVRQCPVGNISMTDGVVSFAKDGRCVACSACFHVCPKNAIQNGRHTRGKHQKVVYERD